MAKMNQCYILASMVIIMLFVLTPSAYADKRLELFLEKYDALNGRKPPLAHVDSPFYPYHKHLFENGLDAAKLKSLRAAQKKGNCILVEELVIEGFLGLFPFLKPAFDDSKRHSKLRFMIAKDHRPEIGRCNDLRGMREMMTLHPLGKLPPVDFAERDFGKSNDLLDPIEISFYLHGFGERAFCNDYPPSIADLRAIANRPAGMVLTEQEGLYLLERAQVHGLEKRKYEDTFARFKKHFSVDANLSRLSATSRRHTLKDIDFKVEGYWQSQCHFLQKFRQREMQK